ncbi:hypothetical protein JW859_01165 [bacterium]|nr:hypothetical protein [bacterium]
MNKSQQIREMLEALSLNYEHNVLDEHMESFDIILDEAEDLVATGLLYETDEGEAFRLLAYMDHLDEDNALEQLSLLMAINGELPLGAYCMDPEEQAIYSTVNLPLADLNQEMLGWLLEYIFAAQDLYFQEFATEDDGDN